jgi:hypothetical protein
MTATFPLEVETLECANETTVAGFFCADVATDDDGTFFDLKSLTADGKTVKPGEWRWGAMAEWLSLQQLRKFSPVHDAMISASGPDERAAAYADHVRSQRAA